MSGSTLERGAMCLARQKTGAAAARLPAEHLELETHEVKYGSR